VGNQQGLILPSARSNTAKIVFLMRSFFSNNEEIIDSFRYDVQEDKDGAEHME